MWRNEHNTGQVFSTSCTQKALPPHPKTPDPSESGSVQTEKSPTKNDLELEPSQPCYSCQKVLTSKAFQNACAVPRPPDDRYKYINVEYRSNRLASLMGRCLQLREIIEDKVRHLLAYVVEL